jgi:alkylated DNA repair dioxygenase AlkB
MDEQTGDAVQPAILGLRYVPEYLEREVHDSLLAAADRSVWQAALGRRVQIYGYSYSHSRRGIYRISDLPDWAAAMAERLYRDGLTATVSDQVVVNDYPPGSGIFSHVDMDVFDDRIVSISLGSSCVMQFNEVASGRVEERLIEPCSALVLSGEARHRWKHAIPARDTDRWMGRELVRGRRVSFTFRRMLVTSGTGGSDLGTGTLGTMKPREV